MTQPTARATLLMAVYDGARFLPDQLHSFDQQSMADWQLIASDDGSSDGSGQIIGDFAAHHRPGQITALDGPCAGSTRNFLSLIDRAPAGVEATFFADQDDVWLPEKLTRALDHLDAVPGGRPALYFSRSLVCGPQLDEPKPSRLHPRGASFANALVQNIASGNTMAVNGPALDLLKAAASHAGGVMVHDWWIYLLLSGAGAQIINDPEPTLLYRQHGGNQISANAGLGAVWRGVARLLRGERAEWITQNLTALAPVSHLLTPENRQLLEEFNALRAMRHGPLRLRALRQSGVHCQTRRAQAGLQAAALLGGL